MFSAGVLVVGTQFTTHLALMHVILMVPAAQRDFTNSALPIGALMERHTHMEGVEDELRNLGDVVGAVFICSPLRFSSMPPGCGRIVDGSYEK